MARLATIQPRLRTLDQRPAQEPPKVADSHYGTPEHRQWRAAVIARAGGRCQDPECQTPNRTVIRLFADHIVELRDGGAATDVRNGMARCGSCHTLKTNAERAKRQARRSVEG